MIDAYLRFIRNKIIKIFKLDPSSLRVPMIIASIFTLNLFCLTTLIYGLNGYSIFGSLIVFMIITIYVIVKKLNNINNKIPSYYKRLDILFKIHVVISFVLFLMVTFLTL